MAMKLFLKDGSTLLLDAPSGYRINPTDAHFIDGLDGLGNPIALIPVHGINAIQMQ